MEGAPGFHLLQEVVPIAVLDGKDLGVLDRLQEFRGGLPGEEARKRRPDPVGGNHVPGLLGAVRGQEIRPQTP